MYRDYYTRRMRFSQGGIFLLTYLAITPKALSECASRPALPLVHVAYAVGQGGCLTPSPAHSGGRRDARETKAGQNTDWSQSPPARPESRGEELLALREKHPSSVYFSRELMAKYFTYSAGNGTHFVLFDDAETLRQKVKLAQNLGIQTAFLMFPEISDLLPEL